MTTIYKGVPFLHILLAVGLFVTILTTYLITNPSWFFDGDDWGLVAKGAECTSFAHFLNFFKYGKLNNLALPVALQSQDLSISPEDTFVNIYYRPLPLVLHAILYQLFGLHAYAYFIFIIMLHALIAVILFLLLSLIVAPSIAWFCSLFFAFHPTLYGWLGKIDTMQNQLNLLLGISMLLALYQGLITQNRRWYLVSCALFFLCLLTRETFFVLPGIIFLWLYQYPIKRNDKFFIITGLCSAIGLYLLLRGLAYPLAMPASSVPHMSPNIIVHLFYDIFWLQWFSWITYTYVQQAQLLSVYKFIKILICCLLVLCCITNSRKKFLVMLLLSGLPLCWPGIYTAGSRLLYEATPVFIIALACAINFSVCGQLRMLRYATLCFLFFLTIFNGLVVISGMHRIMYEPRKINAAIDTLQKTVGTTLNHKPLLLITSDTFSNTLGVVQAIQLRGISTTLPHYFVRSLIMRTAKELENTKNLVRAEKTKQEIRIISNNPDKVWFEQIPPEGPLVPTITITINKTKSNANDIIDLTLTMEKPYFHEDLIVLAWFFDQETFEVCNT